MEAGLIAARCASYLALILVAGLPTYSVFAGIPFPAGRARLLLVAVALSALATSAWWALASVASMAGRGLGEVDRDTVLAVLEATPLGGVLVVRAIALGLLILACLVCPQRFRGPVASLCGAAALASSAWTGHAGAGEGLVHQVMDALHLLAAAVWLGGIVVLLGGQVRGIAAPEQLRRLRGFAGIGTVVVLLLLATGIANIVGILGWPLPSAAFTSDWAAVLAVKLALFSGMLGFAAHNRWRLVPAIVADKPHAARRLDRSLAGELLLGTAVIALVAILGTLDTGS